ncbi:hypothetical protein QQX09_13885 [Demequina sp. SYSU T00192]|uniref:Uncharacterized protein n=1 Tax=Demequina litoralis TaxID=3051660 RepID=A0ABT8GCS5_9MICO|nr:hypothetical protein [Demequina sp. SYSU T00192]MDN4476945.1 hypothetical protein [Demequina sp. SYSU T00192]
MSIDWSFLVPGLIVALFAGAAVGGFLDLSRRVEERRTRRRLFAEEAPVALSSAHDLLIPPLPKDPTSLVPPEEITRGLREQVARLERGTTRQRAAVPAIDMLLEISRALEDMTVRGRALDLRLETVMADAPQTLEHKLVVKLARQAILKDPTPADVIPRIDNPEAQASMTRDDAVVSEIVRYRRAQQLLHDARDAFVDHWWTVRDLRLAAATRLATARHEGGDSGKSAARAVERDLESAIAADFRRNWARIDHAIPLADLADATAANLGASTPAEEAAAPEDKGPAARPGRIQL